MNDNPLISVIIPIYNVEQYLKRCVESLRHPVLIGLRKEKNTVLTYLIQS